MCCYAADGPDKEGEKHEYSRGENTHRFQKTKTPKKKNENLRYLRHLFQMICNQNNLI